MSKFIDLSGNKYDMLFVERRVGSDSHGNATYQCVCDCGNRVIVGANNIRNGNTHSCGCFKKEIMSKKQYKHGGTGGRHNPQERLYGIWRGMISRCYIKSAAGYNDYGGRGITVCEEWKNNYSSFKTWSLSSGYNDDLTIDRIDNNGNYEPCNCRWVTMKTQMNNKRNNHLINYNGEQKTLTEWAESIGIPRSIISQRINRYHWSIEKALCTAVGGKT